MSTMKRDFDSEAAQWDNPHRIKLSKELISAILKKNTINSTSDIMDFGCGTGLLTIQLSQLAKTVTSVDSSSGMLDILRKKTDDGNITNVKIKKTDPDNGETLEGSFDSVISSMTLHHIKNIQFLIREFYRVLKDRGYLFIADLDLDEGQFHSDNTGVFHFGFDRDELRQILLEAGFKNISIETATSITKPVGTTQELKQFTIFLISGQKI